MKKFSVLNLFVLVALILAACAPAATTVAPSPVPPTKAPEPTKAPTVAPTVVPTKPPEPTKPPAATVAPTAVPQLYTITINLKKDIKWSDGTVFSTKDIIGTYNIFWAQSDSIWTYVTNIEAKSDTQVEFTVNSVATRPVIAILRSNIVRPYSQYSKLMDAAGELRKKAADRKGDEVKKFLDELAAFKPTDTVVNGPFKIDPKSVTEAQLTMVKNPTGYNASKIGFETLTMYYGETAATVPLVLAGKIDYSTHGYTPANISAFKAMPEIKIIKGPTGTGPGFWFNQSYYPNTKVEFRQALAYIIDREENAVVSLGEAGKALTYMAGFTDSAVAGFLSKDAIAKLNPYKKDLKKAEELLTKIGFKKGTDGKYADDKGKLVELELSVPSDFADWFASAENAAQQLNKFGIKSTVRGYQSSERATVQSEGKYQILVDLAIYYNPPHPQTSFNYYLNTPRNNPNTESKPAGFNWPWKQKDSKGNDVMVTDLLSKAVSSNELSVVQPYLDELALLVNRELPVLAFFERYSNDPINTKNVTGWKALDDKIYLNNQAGSNYAAIQMIEGTLKPGPGVKTFSSSYPYPQPPKGHYNAFTTDSIPIGLGSFHYPMQYLPLFWYMYADNQYVPVLAESYTIAKK